MLETNYTYFYSENYQPIDKIVNSTGKQLSLTTDEVKQDMQVLRTGETPDSEVTSSHKSLTSSPKKNSLEGVKTLLFSID